ncbi:MAG: TRAP transporter small permease subunit [Deltaproteobacteria bacterium]|nr:TRAP transporter small permease subunit [Deltaproteobacteria bacterium]
MKIQKFIKICDRVSEKTGWAASWLIWVAMVLCVYEIFTRRFFDSPHIWTYEVTNIFYAANFMLLAAYTLLHKGHVAVDILYVRFKPKTQRTLDTINYLIFFFPFILVLLYVGADSAISSWAVYERTSIGLPLLYPLLKTVTPATALLLLMQGVSEFAKRFSPAEKGEGA